VISNVNSSQGSSANRQDGQTIIMCKQVD